MGPIKHSILGTRMQCNARKANNEKLNTCHGGMFKGGIRSVILSGLAVYSLVLRINGKLLLMKIILL